MATVDKNFRIKNGLVVEGTTATVNGNDILTKNTQDGDSYIINLIGGTATSQNTANTVVKRDANGDFAAGIITANIVGNVTGTVSDISNHSTSSLLEGTNLYFTNQRAIDANTGLWDSTGAAAQALSDAQDYADTAEQDAKDYADGLAVNYDAAGSAAAAQTAAQNYADGLAVNYDAAGSATSAENAAKFYADGLIADLGGSGTASVAGNIDILTGTGIQVNGGNNSVEIDRQTVDTWYDAAGSASAAQQAAQLYADDAVASLVGSAPAVLDTIQELATALENNPDIIADLENVAAGKQNTLTAGSNIDITQDTISVTGLDTDDVTEGLNRLYFTNTRAQNAIGAGTGLTKDNQGTELAINRQAVDTWYDAAGAAASAQSAAESYADGLAVNYDAVGSAALAQSAAEATALGYVSDVLDGTSSFTAVNVNDQAKQVAASSTSLGSVPVTAYEWSKAAYRSAKFLVKIDNGTHNEISEILLTLDSSDNIAITEYAVVGTNGARGTITADVSGSNVRVRVTPVNDSTIKISGTLLA